MNSKKKRVFLYHVANEAKKQAVVEGTLVPRLKSFPVASAKWSFRDLCDMTPAILFAISLAEKKKKKGYINVLKKYWDVHACLPDYLDMTQRDFEVFFDCLPDAIILLQMTYSIWGDKGNKLTPYCWENQEDIRCWENTL